MRHRIKSNKVASFSPEELEAKMKEKQRNEQIDAEVEEIFEEDTSYSDSDEALAAMEFYDTPDEIE